jgi:hypothetical protein
MVGLALTTPGAAWTAHADGDGAWGGPNRNKPRFVITAPVDGSEFRVGVPVTLRAEPGPGKAGGGDDPRWIVIRHTGAGAETVAEAVGEHATFTPSDRLGSDTSYEIVVTTGKGLGPGSRQSVTIVPKTVELTLSSEPGGAALGWDDTTSTEPRTMSEPVGRRIALSAARASSPSGGGELVFDSWSDDGAREREYVVPDEPTALIARYRAPAIGVGGAPLVGGETGASDGEPQKADAGDEEPRIAIGEALRVSAPAPRYDIGTALRITGTTRGRLVRTLSGRIRGGTRGARVEVAIRRGESRSRWMRANARRTRSGWSWNLKLARPLEGPCVTVVRVVDARGRVIAKQL